MIPMVTVDTSALLTAVPQQGKPRSLYYLTDGSVWVIRHDTSTAERVTPSESIVTAFDVWPDDGRLAYATKSGKLYVMMPGSSPDLLLDLDGKAEKPAFITGMDFSPRGEALAFTVDFDGQGDNVMMNYPSYPSGLWMMNIFDRQATWLKSNHYLNTIEGDVNLFEIFYAPVWSPDGLSILVSGGYYEWSNMSWFFPLKYAEDKTYQHSLPSAPNGGGPATWTNGSWMPDGQGLLLSGVGYATYGDLMWVDRATGDSKPLIDGEMAKLYIHDAYAVPEDAYLPGETEGIHSGPNRYLFLASCPDCADSQAQRLHVRVFINGSLQGQAVGPENLCTLSDQYGNRNYPRSIIWTPDFAGGVLICGPNEISILDMRKDVSQTVDILPYLSGVPSGETPIFKWGEN
jgi:hypothetical protein